jgi:NTP pyrophosphatase (non-canonical NTP hydrolase)
VNTLEQLQTEHAPWLARNFPEQTAHQALLGAMEELGELAHAHLKAEQGIRGDDKLHMAEKIDAIGDIVIYLASYCTTNGISLEEAVWTTWEKVRRRNWQRNPLTGQIS